MARKALCVGINDYPGVTGDLKGCVNDARGWAGLLTDHYDFAPADVRLLLDAQATRRQILDGLDGMLAGARAGDLLVFTNSSHGTYVPDTTGDEVDYDEAICPYDYRSNLIVDDELRERFAGLAPGVQLVFVSDSCHSGTVSRFTPRSSGYRRGRFLAPEEWGGRSLVAPLRAKKELHPESEMNEILLAGCKPNQYSYDAEIGGTYHGAMTYYALQAIREHRYDLSYADLHARLCELVADANFPQDPLLEGRDENKKRRVFA